MNDYTEYLTPENARRYAELTPAERFRFCSRFTGYTDSSVTDALERELAELAIRLELEEEAENDRLDYDEREKLYL